MSYVLYAAGWRRLHPLIGLFLGLFLGLWLCEGASAVAAQGHGTPDKAPDGGAPQEEVLTRRPTAEEVVVLEKMAGAMIMMGFRGTELTPDDPFLEAVRSGKVGHVLLFDREPGASKRDAASPEQVRALVRTLREAAAGPLLIAVNHEGGKTRTLRTEPDAAALPLPSVLGRGTPGNTHVLAIGLGLALADLGILVNLAPGVDVNSNPDNPAIGRSGRSFSADAALTSKHGMAFAQGMIKAGVIPTLKHFPGHGGADGDPHSDLPDITARWNSGTDLKPYVDALHNGWPGMIMVGHLLHKTLDPEYPASLSPKIVNGLLRTTLGWAGVVITDDMQLRAITDRFSLEQSIALAVNAGCDILLFTNNPRWDPDLPRTAHAALVRLARRGVISQERILQSWQRITKLYAGLADADVELVSDPGEPMVRIQ
jgi:beta-N-acetylhexosaminidase